MPATSTNIADYNEFVDDLANDEQPALAALGTMWSVIGSTEDDSAVLNTMTDPSPFGSTGVPIYQLDGTKIADDYDDLWDGDLDATLSVMENGSAYFGLVWTGTTFDGQGDAGSQLGADNPMRGTRRLHHPPGSHLVSMIQKPQHFVFTLFLAYLLAPQCLSRVHFYASVAWVGCLDWVHLAGRS